MEDPGNLPNPGFETGDLSGFLVPSWGSSNLQLVGSGGPLVPAQGKYAVHLSDLDREVVVSLTARIDLPATAKQVVVVIDRVETGQTNWSSSDDGIAAVVADTTKRTTFPLRPLLKAATLPVATLPGYLHSGYQDLTLDISAFAGQTISLTIGKLRASTCCGPCPAPFGFGPDLVIDDIRVK